MKLIKLTTGPKDHKTHIYFNPLLIGVVKQQTGDFRSVVVHSGTAYPVYEPADEIAGRVNAELDTEGQGGNDGQR